jgi:hypothetical protein
MCQRKDAGLKTHPRREKARLGSRCAAVRENGLLSGRMISVLPEGPLGVDGVPGTRRVELRTTLSPMGRNPITGGVPDRLIVLRGGVGTLVELAFALRPDDIVPTVFARSLEYLRQQNTQNRDQILVNIRDARPDVDATVLHNALSAQLALSQDVDGNRQGNGAIAIAAVDGALAGIPDVGMSGVTRFEGIPSAHAGHERLLKAKFEVVIQKLSELEPGATFD